MALRPGDLCVVTLSRILPSMGFLIAILFWLIKSVKALSGLPLEEIILIEETEQNTTREP